MIIRTPADKFGNGLVFYTPYLLWSSVFIILQFCITTSLFLFDLTASIGGTSNGFSTAICGACKPDPVLFVIELYLDACSRPPCQTKSIVVAP